MLVHKTIVDYINKRILPYDAGLTEGYTIAMLEHELSAEVGFGGSGTGGLSAGGSSAGGLSTGGGRGHSEQNDTERRVVFRGFADRIDRLREGTLRIVDYKTGSAKNNASALLQMKLYAMMVERGGNDGGDGDGYGSGDGSGNSNGGGDGSGNGNGGGNGGIGSGQKALPVLYYVRDMPKSDHVPPVVEPEPDFEDELRANLRELFDPAVPFTQTPDPKPCQWCDFRTICRR
jgi:hypothetical protein